MYKCCTSVVQALPLRYNSKVMASIHFTVRSTVKGKLTPVYLKFSAGRGANTSVKTGYEVFPEYWSNTREDLKDSITENGIKTVEELAEDRKRFIKLRNAVETGLNDLASKGEKPSREWLGNLITNHHNPQKRPSKPETLTQYIDRFIKEIESGQRVHGDSMKYRHGTIKSYKGTQSQLKEYCDGSKGRKTINFDDVTIDLYNNLIRFFNDKNYAPNTIGRHIKNLKVIMREAREDGLHQNNEIERKGFKVIRAKVENVYLTVEEIKRIANLDLTGNPAWNLARDIFLIGCHTAQRFSDYSRITPEMIRIEKKEIEIPAIKKGKPTKVIVERKVIDLIQQKTGQRVNIPVSPDLDILLQKYDYRLPKTWEQKVNQYIKKVAEKAGISDKIRVEESKGGLIIKSYVTKSDLIKTHTARRSGCTNMYLGGVPTLAIMSISGHKTEKEFLKYINVTSEQNATVLLDHPYFNSGNMKIAK